jgi:hypothetical protein
MSSFVYRAHAAHSQKQLVSVRAAAAVISDHKNRSCFHDRTSVNIRAGWISSCGTHTSALLTLRSAACNTFIAAAFRCDT